jgi:membrane protein DedA with SNARE-associated domain
MDNILGVRPRTKEFALGHPLMLLLCYLGYRNNRFLPILLLGAIGQVSLVNTFAHIHTPLLVSALRTVNGLWLGIIIGLILIGIVTAVLRYRKKRQQKQHTG